MVYLTKCVERQGREQKQYRPSRRRLGVIPPRAVLSAAATAVVATVSSSSENQISSTTSAAGTPVTNRNQTQHESVNRGINVGGTSDDPEHDLEPSMFAKEALEMVLDSQSAAASLLWGKESKEDALHAS